MRNRYDAASKWLIEAFAGELLRIAGVGPVTKVQPLPGELVQSRQLPDGLVEVTLAGRADPVLHLIEVNTYPYSRVPEELLDDIALTYLNRRVVPEVVALTLCEKGHVRIDPNIRVTSPSGLTRLDAGWRVVNLWELYAADFLPLTDPGLAPWIPLMKIDGAAEPVLQQCREAIDKVPTTSRHENLLVVTQMLGSLRWDKNLLKAIFAKEGKMIESPILQDWLREREVAAYHRAILEGLEVRFGRVPEDVSAAVRVITDLDRVTELHKASYVCASLDDFRKALTPPQPPAAPTTN